MAEETKWYALRVISGKERKLNEYINKEVERSGWGHIIKQVLVPTEKVYKIRNGKKQITERNFFPGYILVEAIEGKLNSEMIGTIAGMTGVIHFLGKENPTPLRNSEVNRILGKVDEMEEMGEGTNEPLMSQ